MTQRLPLADRLSSALHLAPTIPSPLPVATPASAAPSSATAAADKARAPMAGLSSHPAPGTEVPGLRRRHVRIGDFKTRVPIPGTQVKKQQFSFFTTGGTISAGGKNKRSYTAGEKSAEALLQGVRPHNSELDIQAFFGAGIDSKDTEDSHWLELLQHLSQPQNWKDKAVMTSGTDALALTTFFLQLCLPSEVHDHKRLVLTGSMEPSGVARPDGPGNLKKAFALAASRLQGRPGVFAEMAGDVFTAPYFDKRHTSARDAFKAIHAPRAGWVKGAFSRLSRTPVPRVQSFDLSEVGALPSVAVVELAPGCNQDAVLDDIRRWSEEGPHKGIVVAGQNGAPLNDRLQAALIRAAASGLHVVRAALPGSGIMPSVPAAEEGGPGFVSAGRLPSPQHARVQLQVALAQAEKQVEQGRLARGDVAKAVRQAFDPYQKAVPGAAYRPTGSGTPVHELRAPDLDDSQWLALLSASRSEDGRPSGKVLSSDAASLSLTSFFLELALPQRNYQAERLVLAGAAPSADGTETEKRGPLRHAQALAQADGRPGVYAQAERKVFVAPYFDQRDERGQRPRFQAVNGPRAGWIAGPLVHLAKSQSEAARMPSFDLEGLSSLPSIAVIEAAPGSNPDSMVADIQRWCAEGRHEGIVIAGTGGGTLNTRLEAALAQAASRGMPVVRASQTGAGEVHRNGHCRDDERGFISAGKLPSAQHARVLLQVALASAKRQAAMGNLAETEVAQTVKQAFDAYQTPPERG